MKIELRNDSVHISGYVNAVGRDSRPLMSPSGKVVEMIEPGTFRNALKRAENVELLLNHNKERKLGSINDGNLTLTEDTIGLKAECTVTDPDVMQEARAGRLSGWSFGMFVNTDNIEERAGDIPRRHVTDIDLFEVSIIDSRMMPCYAGTSLECRADAEIVAETRAIEDKEHDISDETAADEEKQEEEARAKVALEEWKARLEELRFNPYHDPSNGRFTTPNGGLGGFLFVGKGQAGKGAYVINKEAFGASNAKHGGFSVTNEEGKTSHYIVKNDTVYGVNDIASDDVMTTAYQNFGGVQGIIDRINKVGKGKAGILNDSEVEKMQDDYRKARKEADKQLDTLISGNKHSVNRHSAYWSQM